MRHLRSEGAHSLDTQRGPEDHSHVGGRRTGGLSVSVLHDFNALQKAYNAGSDAVHSRRRIHGTEEQLTAGQELCRDEILKMLQLGRTPEWRTLVLGKAP